MNQMTRRDFLALSCVTVFAPFVVTAQSLPPVRLLILRRPAVLGSDNCSAPCIRGSIYDVSFEGVFAPDTWSIPFGQVPICDVIERPWANNAPNVSAIPAGTYTAHVRDDATKTWMTNLNRRWRLQIDSVQSRSSIQFHYGKDEQWSQGCFIVGDHLVDAPSLNDLSGPYCKVSNGEAAIERLRAAVTLPSVDNRKIEIAVSSRGSLFADMTQGC
ncbi:MAG: hypothetical protein INF92_13600 [Rhodobacter sp.]|nr:hypothetical protein [Rhodobacter sp.]